MHQRSVSSLLPTQSLVLLAGTSSLLSVTLCSLSFLEPFIFSPLHFSSHSLLILLLAFTPITFLFHSFTLLLHDPLTSLLNSLITHHSPLHSPLSNLHSPLSSLDPQIRINFPFTFMNTETMSTSHSPSPNNNLSTSPSCSQQPYPSSHSQPHADHALPAETDVVVVGNDFYNEKY